MRVIADKHDASVAQVALAWLLAQPAVTSVLLGASKLHQLEDNLGALDVRLSADEIAELSEAMPPAPVYPNWFIESMQDQPATEALGRG